jgi:hypothetical protein
MDVRTEPKSYHGTKFFTSIKIQTLFGNRNIAYIRAYFDPFALKTDGSFSRLGDIPSLYIMIHSGPVFFVTCDGR